MDVCVKYIKIDLALYKDDLEKRFEYFVNKIWSKILDDKSVN
jgi:hypothetical protein